MDDRIWEPTVFTKDRQRLLDGEIAQAFLERGPGRIGKAAVCKPVLRRVARRDVGGGELRTVDEYSDLAGLAIAGL